MDTLFDNRSSLSEHSGMIAVNLKIESVIFEFDKTRFFLGLLLWLFSKPLKPLPCHENLGALRLNEQTVTYVNDEVDDVRWNLRSQLDAKLNIESSKNAFRQGLFALDHVSVLVLDI